ncbi:gluconate 2-dehydrogenase subunit 3 family protein [Nitriliruptor alkaliphilus]|uniref:gluconate 2-dehydrogenase subunit 3 family protein n=1 Tax=Nitriliruptor alkaliphilus TaxID=427918 RepID=UPI000698F950|nr:gluconate 2-dehydrogenase subunit 3 family protein [Nitriliruptor alkaliphilus]
MDGRGGRVSRRTVLKGAGALGLVWVAGFGRAGAAIAVPVGGDLPRFLDDTELATLRALVDRFIPGVPDDTDPGAVEAGCAEAIDALLAAFSVDPPLIYAGGPFSDRAGSATNDFASFVPLDAYEAAAWRLRIEGSGGRTELEFNGPVRGFQAVYREGLAALEDAAGGAFAELPGPVRDVVLRTSHDPAVLGLIDIAFPHTLEFMYGAPEYGGNRDLVGWRITGYDGDVQPRGWTDEQVEQADSPGAADILSDTGLTLEQLLVFAPLTTTEQAAGMQARSGGRLRALRAEADVIRDGLREHERRSAALAAAIAEVAGAVGGGGDGR